MKLARMSKKPRGRQNNSLRLAGRGLSAWSMPDEAEPPPRQLSFKEAQFERVNAPEGSEPPSARIDPLEILRANRAHEKAQNTVYDQSPKPVPRISRRIREYVGILIAVDVVLIWLLFTGFGLVADLYLFAGLLIFSSGWTWVMLFVIDDY
jgi:hypothetical protein